MSESIVYFAQRADGLIKIGVTTRVRPRMRSLQATLLGAEPGGYEREAELHRRIFGVHWVEGEWFEPAPELLTYIERLPRGSWFDEAKSPRRSWHRPTGLCLSNRFRMADRLAGGRLAEIIHEHRSRLIPTSWDIIARELEIAYGIRAGSPTIKRWIETWDALAERTQQKAAS